MKFKQQISKFLWDIPPVVIAVLLALGLNTWKENRSEAAAAKESLKAIIMELDANEASIQGFRDDNKKHMDNLYALLDSMESANITTLETSDYDFSFRILSSSVWETSQTREIAKYHSPDIIRDIAKLYNLQKLIDGVWQTHLNKITSTEFHTGVTTTGKIEAHRDLLEISVSIADVYLEAKKNLDPDFENVLKD